MLAEQVYESLIGELVDPLPGVTNAFSEGELCAKCYEEIYMANCRLCERLGVEEDTDVEIILDNFFEINRELCHRMFDYGKRYGMSGL